jgi:fumarate hydratase subunit alpha
MRLNPKVLEEVAVKLLSKAATQLPKDVKEALKLAYEREDSLTAKTELKNILSNIESAEKLGKPLCQDTGMISFYIKAREIENFSEVKKALINATIKATETIPLRPNAVHPLTRKNTGTNVGEHIPHIEWVYTDQDYVELLASIKGGGSENMSALAMITPGLGVKGIKRFVVDTVVKAGAQPCPPTVVGVGLGGTVEISFKLAKLALLRPIGSRNQDKDVANLEDELFNLINQTGIGPMGLGGKTTCLDVKIEYAHCHTATLPVAVYFQCWADRRAAAKIGLDGSFEFIV